MMTLDADVIERALSYMRHQAAKSLAGLASLMERTGAECARCLEGVSEEQAAFKYDEEWPIKDVVSHMLHSGQEVNHEIANLVKANPSSKGARIGVVSGADRHIEELRQTLADLWAETARLVVSLPEDGNIERTWEHPWFGPLNFREWIAFQRMHAMDHIRQMEKVKARPDYPKA